MIPSLGEGMGKRMGKTWEKNKKKLKEKKEASARCHTHCWLDLGVTFFYFDLFLFYSVLIPFTILNPH